MLESLHCSLTEELIVLKLKSQRDWTSKQKSDFGRAEVTMSLTPFWVNLLKVKYQQKFKDDC